MAAPDAILKLIELFDRNRDAYLSGAYKEAQLRHEFIDPFFKALGWDIYNESGYAEAYKDVIYEDAIKVGGIREVGGLAQISTGHFASRAAYAILRLTRVSLSKLISVGIP
jgi:hypothetical protein